MLVLQSLCIPLDSIVPERAVVHGRNFSPILIDPSNVTLQERLRSDLLCLRKILVPHDLILLSHWVFVGFDSGWSPPFTAFLCFVFVLDAWYLEDDG